MFSRLPADTKATEFFWAGGRDMEQTLWNLFRETGDPMGYLLYRAEAQGREKQGRQAAPEKEQTPPSLGPPPGSD